jgi:hypothetical protein
MTLTASSLLQLRGMGKVRMRPSSGNTKVWTDSRSTVINNCTDRDGGPEFFADAVSHDLDAAEAARKRLAGVISLSALIGGTPSPSHIMNVLQDVQNQNCAAHSASRTMTKTTKTAPRPRRMKTAKVMKNTRASDCSRSKGRLSRMETSRSRLGLVRIRRTRSLGVNMAKVADRGKRGAMWREPLVGNTGENSESHKPVHETTTDS